MGGIASKAQLRSSFLRRAMVIVPLVLLLGYAAGRLVPNGSDNLWYTRLAKPALNPPDWMFAVVWPTLYVLIGLALAMIVNARGARGRWLAVALFVAQFSVSLVWMPLFFGAHRIGSAFWVLVAVVALAIVATLLFGRIRTAAAWLMVPYLVWISFAASLNWRIGVMNPSAETLASSPRATQILP